MGRDHQCVDAEGKSTRAVRLSIRTWPRFIIRGLRARHELDAMNDVPSDGSSTLTDPAEDTALAQRRKYLEEEILIAHGRYERRMAVYSLWETQWS